MGIHIPSRVGSVARTVYRNIWFRVIGFTVVAGTVFVFGVLVGDGRVHLALLPTAMTENPGLPDQLDYSSINQVYASLKSNYDGKLTAAQLLDGLKAGLADATNDPYTQYFNAGQAKQFENQLNNSFSGIGAELGKDADGNLIIVSPIKGFPADKAGLQPKDVIASINGENTANMATDIAAGKIRGPKGTTVTLKIIRDKTQDLMFTISRDDIHLPSVTSKVLSGNIGYMEISSFSNDTAQLASQAAQNFKAAGVKGVILDLRGNPGGLLDAAVQVSNLWVQPGKTIVTERGTNGDQSYTATLNPILGGIPTVVLINDGSASASEITAGALHDNGAAYLIGTQSFGKGVVQQIFEYADGSELKVTVASWYRPNGQNINKKGITPDQTVTLSDADAKAGNDTQLQAARNYLDR